MDTRQIIDYAADDNGVEFRNALYASIHDKVTAHIDAKKQEVAQSFFNQTHDPMAMVQDTPVENA